MKMMTNVKLGTTTPPDSTLSIVNNCNSIKVSPNYLQNSDEISLSENLSNISFNSGPHTPLKESSKSNSNTLKVPNIEEFKSNLPEIKKSLELKPDFTKCPGLKFLSVQRERLACRKGGNFSIMLAGARGTGKTTLLNSLFSSELLKLDQENVQDDNISVNRFELKEEKLTLNLQVIETVNFGNTLDNSKAWESICKYIDDQFLKYLQQSQQPHRKNLYDTRIHCCLYFLNPSKCCLSELDIQTMKNLSTRVNLIPVVSKSDILTPEELKNFKSTVKNIFHEYDIKICQYFSDLSLVKFIDSLIPFSIIGSIDKYENDQGEYVRGRKYHWGLVEIENINHCDFSLLRNLLISENMLEFILSTEIYYENFRSYYLTGKVESVLEGGNRQDILKLRGFEQLKAYTNVETLENNTSSLEKNWELTLFEIYEKKKQELDEKWDKKYAEKEEEVKLKKQKLFKLQEDLRFDLQETNIKRKKLIDIVELISLQPSESRNISESSVLVNSEVASSQSCESIQKES
ncbi:Sporulation-regulated protein 3 [Spathaspora sp. JA1]|nr:Sporulation-regulated protein 3 [Spathaspora sp. JA1]